MKTLEKTVKKQLEKIFGSNLKQHEFLRFHTTFRIGGPADYFITPKELKTFVQGLKFLHDNHVPVLVLGSGSNVLIKDTCIKKVVFNFKELTDYIIIKDEMIFVGSGVSLIKLSNEVAGAGLSGLEWAAAIPGTVGGAIKGNAGAFGVSMSDVITGVDGVLGDGTTSMLHRGEISFNYRSSDLPEDFVILNSSIRLKKSSKRQIVKLMQKLNRQRLDTQPIGKRSAGSIFKNPKGKFAGELIEKAGLKGYVFRGAKISDTHANFIINESNASATDVLNLIDLISTSIFNKFGIKLELEIKILGE